MALCYSHTKPMDFTILNSFLSSCFKNVLRDIIALAFMECVLECPNQLRTIGSEGHFKPDQHNYGIIQQDIQ